MKVFLLQDIKGIGKSGQIVEVANGYAHNLLLPRKMCLEYSKLTEQDILNRQKINEKALQAKQKETDELFVKIEKLTLTFKVKTHEGKVYGSVSASDIVDELAKQDVKVTKSQVLLQKPIKELGQQSVTVKLSNRLQPSVRIKITSIAS